MIYTILGWYHCHGSLYKQPNSWGNLQLDTIHLAQIEELGDLVGFPIRQFQMVKQDDDNKWVKKWADEHLVSVCSIYRHSQVYGYT